MHKIFVTKEIAYKLKEKGFNDASLAVYKNDKFYHIFETFQLQDFSDCVKVPTWEQATDWLRNVKKIEVNPFKWGVVCYHVNENNVETKALPHYIFDLERSFEYSNDFLYQSIDDDLKYHSYEECREAAILKAIETIEIC